MRIGQLARKYNVNQENVIQFLNEVQADLSPFHHNSKVSSDIEELVIDHFSLASKEAEEVSDKEVEETTEVLIEDIPAVADEQNLDVSEVEPDNKTEADLQRELDPTLPQIKTSAIEKKDDKSIDTDRLMELLEDDEASDDLSKITHIKAPKKELSGLKVVGKIELAEPKSKSVDQSENQDKAPISVRNKRHEGQRLSEEERTNRRIKAKENKEQFEARQEKRRIETEKKKRKAQNRVRYEEKMQKVKAAQAKQKMQKEEVVLEVNDQPQAFKPITIFDKFWKLFNL